MQSGTARLSPEAILDRLDPEQREVASTLRGPLVVLAGAGTGKTRAITHRIAYGVRTGEYQPTAVLAVTFTTRAAGEMRSRLRELGAPGVQARTFHAAALKQLKYFWPRAIGGPMWELIEYKGRYLAQAARHIGIKVDQVAIRDLASEVEWMKVSMIDPVNYVYKAAAIGREPPSGYNAEQIVALALAYEDMKQAQQIVDFEDILTILGALLAENSSIADQVRRQYRHFVVDEYQDVSPVQQFLLEQWLGGRDELCVVGDPSQTIYSFTGARPTYLLQFQQKYPRAQEIRLVRDYRSTPQIVRLANEVLKEGKVEGALMLKSQKAPGLEPKYRIYDDDEQEANGIAASIANLIAQGTKASDIAILYRTNAQSVAFEQALTSAQVGFQVKGGEQFFARPDVRRAISLLETAIAADLGGGDLQAQVRQILTPAGWSETPVTTVGAARERWEAMCAIVTLADEMAAKGTPANPTTLAELGAELRERAAHQNAPTINGVTLASLHAAKGLEWAAVFLAGMSEGLMPISLADSPEAVAEERRLLYVGITRAQEHLEISFSRSKTGGRGNRKPTRFLASRFPQPNQQKAALKGLSGAQATRRLGKMQKSDLSEDDAILFEQLRTWRAQEANSQGKPAFTVLADTSLVAISMARPADEEALSRMPGIGPVKMQNYGEQILQIVRNYR